MRQLRWFSIYKIIVLFIVAVQIISPVAAQENAYCESRFRIMFGNGILNDEEDWYNSSQALRAMIGDTFNEVPITYGLAKNPSDGFLLDLYQVFQQKISEDPSLSWEAFFRVFLGITDILTAGFVSFVQAVIANVTSNNAQQLVQKYQNQYDYADMDMVLQAAEVKESIRTDGKRVLVLAHSQGGLYANATHRLVYADPQINRKSFGVVAVATPANFVAGNGPYITSDNDGVIKAVRQFIAPQTLPSNVSIPFNFGDVSGHMFVRTYLNATYPGREVIASRMKESLFALERPDDTYDFEIRMHQLLDEGHPSGTENASIEVFRKGMGQDFASWLKQATGKTTYWTISDKSKKKLDAFDPADKQEAILAAEEIKNRISPFVPNAALQGTALNAFLSGKGPIYGVWTDYLNGLVEPEGFDFNGPTTPVDDPAWTFPLGSRLWELKLPIGSLTPGYVIYNNYYLKPLMDDLAKIPSSVAKREASVERIVLKVCKPPPV